MVFSPFEYLQARRIRDIKRKQRAERIAALPSSYHSALSAFDKRVIDAPIGSLVADVRQGAVSAVDVLRTYGKVAVQAQEKTNCVTELLLPEAEQWAAEKDVNKQGPLAGIPVSVKDTFIVKGFDVSVGFARKSLRPWGEDGASIKLLKDAGAVPYAKTNIPVTLLSFDSNNPVWGSTTNPYGADYMAGGSTGGEGALLALGGRIGIGSDVAGSVRLPAAWCGIYGLKSSAGRWPRVGNDTSMTGQEGVPASYSPMARTMEDLTYFTQAVIGMQPWKYDFSLAPLSWRPDEAQLVKSRKLRVGLLVNDGVVPPTPAIARALNETAAALKAQGQEVVPVTPPKTATPLEGLRIASQLLCADGVRMVGSHLMSGEFTDPGVKQLNRFASLPKPLRYLYYLYIRYIKRDTLYAYLLRDFGRKSVLESWALVTQRDVFRAAWFDWWNAREQNYDFLLCPVNATPALPHGAMHDAMSACGYTFLFNLLDYTAGVVPVGAVDGARDQLVTSSSSSNKRTTYVDCLREAKADNAIARGAWKHYDADKMHGLPAAVQVVGRKYEEEKVLACMEVVDEALRKSGVRDGKTT